MEYLNFELRIGVKNGEKYPVTVIDSPVGGTSTMVHIPMDDPHFQNSLQNIEDRRNLGKTRRKNSDRIIVKRGGMGLSSDQVFTSVKDFGTDLFNRLFTDKINSTFRASLHKAREEKMGLRIKLGIVAAELSSLPWEYLYDKEIGDYLCLSIETPIVRFLELTRPSETLVIKPPLNILGVIASPSDLPTLDVKKEKAQMNMAIEHLIGKGFITLTWLEGQTWRDLDKALRKNTWHMMHFIGHGGFDPNSGESTIALANEDGTTYHLSATSLGRMLEGHHSMRLVVLNSCEGARTSDEDIFSSSGASLIRKGIPAVVSMQYEITDRAALEFSRTFYESIAEGIPVDTAVQEARKAITFADENSSEWATPVLNMRSTDGRLFDFDVSSAIFSDEQGPDKIVYPEKIRVPDDSPPPSITNNQGLNILQNKVKKFWITGVLEPSIKHSSLIKLGMDNMPDMVDSPWGNSPIGKNDSINTVFNEIGRSMLILGEPGAGKTTLLLTLAKELLNQFESTPGLALPVVFNLSSWTHSGKTLVEWLVDELSTKYLIPRNIGANWLKNNLLLPLLDGLDEVGIDRRNDCVNAINTFLKDAAVTGVVVCCRFGEYLELDSKLIMNGAIRVRLLSKEKIMNFLHDAGSSYEGLRELLMKDSTFLKLAETPFMLSLMMRTYQNIGADQLINEELQSMTEKRIQLMDAFVKKRFRLVETGSTL